MAMLQSELFEEGAPSRIRSFHFACHFKRSWLMFAMMENSAGKHLSSFCLGHLKLSL